MKLQSIPRLRKEDLPDAPKWVSKLLAPINMFFENVYNALTGGLTLSENVQAQIHTASIRSDEIPYTFKKTIGEKAKCVIIAQIYEKENVDSLVSGSVYADWIETNDGIKIKKITGIATDIKYVVTFLVF